MTPEEFVKKVYEIKHQAALDEKKDEIEDICCEKLGMDLASFRLAYEAARMVLRYTNQFEVYFANPTDALAAMSVLRMHYGLPQNSEKDKQHIETKVLPGKNHWL